MQKDQKHPASITSKNLLAHALVQLLQEQSYQSITITALCQRAQIARRTFYRNFDTIEDVLSYYTASVIDEFAEAMAHCDGQEKRATILAYFSFWSAYKKLLLLLNRNNLIPVIFSDYIRSMYRFPMLCTAQSDGMSRSELACRLSFVAGGLWSVLTYWVANGCIETPESLADNLCAL